MKKFIDIELPKNFMNVSITDNNELVADNNSSSEWDTLKFPLPKRVWGVYSYEATVDNQNAKSIARLVDCRGWIRRFLEV